MFPYIINPLPIALTLATSFGVLLHDTQLDRATTTALTLPAIVAAYGAADIGLKLSDGHTHTERVSLGASQPRIQPRGHDDKKYMLNKKLHINSSGSDYSWPSI